MFCAPLYSMPNAVNRASAAAGGGFVGALDGHTDGLTLAYSVSRRLLASYEGALIRVRRTSDNAEMDIPYGVDNLLDQSALVAFSESGDCYVARVYDQSGGGRHLEELTASAQARIVSAGFIDGTTGLGRPVMFADNPFATYTAGFGGQQTPTAYTFAFAGVLTQQDGGYNGYLHGPGAGWNTGGSICLWMSGNETQVQNFTGVAPRSEVVLVGAGQAVVLGVTVGPDDVAHYRDGSPVGVPETYSPTFDFNSFSLWANSLNTSGRFSEAVLWLGWRGESLATFQDDQEAYFGFDL